MSTTEAPEPTWRIRRLCRPVPVFDCRCSAEAHAPLVRWVVYQRTRTGIWIWMRLFRTGAEAIAAFAAGGHA